ncbi:hypothetical protein BU23DRAFT_531789 [Bimuria novae-zelandiae CBS 107.79]|uniref:ABM domain-containing protein n=1 Tax=Bimuria novae-zelandiae CBS 107.79 TaxID=1447943 RepID=A0A6A5VAW3_9PLEO|nr:hypothetical protein BU23DRAFT_531789 [Bimuria novae-zelandiae CBS 107.79]
MPNFVVLAQLPFASDNARNIALEKLLKISDFSKANEPDTLRYFFATPRDEADVKLLYVIEEYTSKAAFDAHMAAEPVKALVAFLTQDPQYLKAESALNMTESYAFFTRPEIVNATDPWICYASIEYKEGKRAEALEPWKHVTSEMEKNEADTLNYSILKDNDHAETIRTLEIYASEEYFKEVHVPSQAVQENMKNYGNEIRASIKHVFLKYRGGFMDR